MYSKLHKMSNLIILAKVKSAMKGDHVYRSGVKVDDKLLCKLEPSTLYSRHAIMVNYYAS